MSDFIVRRLKFLHWPFPSRWPWRWWRWCFWWGRCTPVVIAVRHADVNPASDPPLNAAGQARAEELRRAIDGAGITAIFTTSWQRTQLTAEPLATELGLTPIVQDDVAATIAAVRALPSDGVVLLVGHTNTVPDLIAGLGGPTITPIAATEFNRLLVLARGRLVTLRYGA